MVRCRPCEGEAAFVGTSPRLAGGYAKSPWEWTYILIESACIWTSVGPIMAGLKRETRGERTYYYIHHTYRWQGQTRQIRRYLGARVPSGLTARLIEVEEEAWSQTWFPLFDAIRARWQARLRSVPREVAEKELHSFTLQFTYDTNRIEGSGLSLEETELAVDRGLSPGGRFISDIVEAREHARLAEHLLQRPPNLTLAEVLRWHAVLFKGTKPGIAGRLRDYEVGIRGSRHHPPTPLEVRPMLIELLRWASRYRGDCHAVERAASLHHRFESIHPFGDGNGRVGRLLMNVELARAGFPPLDVRYDRRRGYYRALERSQLEGDPRPFVGWFFRRYRAEWRTLRPVAVDERKDR